MDRLTQMGAFVRVVEAGSFSEAARRSGQSKAVMSKYVASLEDHLGVALLRRTTRALRLTSAGERYLKRCRELLGELDRLEADTREDDLVVAGTLRVAAPPDLVAENLDAILTRFVNKHPLVRFDLNLTYRMVDLVNEAIDVAIRLTKPQDSSLVARRIAPIPLIAVGAPSYLGRFGRPKNARDLTHHACLVDTNHRDQQRWRIRGEHRIETVVVDGPFRANSPTVIRDLAIAGHGIALLPKFIADEALADKRLVEVLRGKVAIDWSLYAVHARRTYVPSRVRAYIDHLVDTFGPPSRKRRTPE